MTSTIAASVVTFRPDPAALVELLGRLDEVFDQIVIIDNGGGAEALTGTPWSPTCSLEANRGMSFALDTACRFASEHGADWLVHFDQDSIPLAGLAEFCSAVLSAPAGAAIIAAPYIDARTGGSGYSAERIRRRPFTPIAAGSAYRLAAWEKIGFDLGFPLDLFDFAYALRVQGAGWSVEVEPSLHLEHEVGFRRTQSLFGVEFVDPGHAPWRTYSKLDATCRAVRVYGLRFPMWVARHLVARSRELAAVVLIGEQRRDQLLQIGRWCLRRRPPEMQNMTTSGSESV